MTKMTEDLDRYKYSIDSIESHISKIEDQDLSVFFRSNPLWTQDMREVEYDIKKGLLLSLLQNNVN